MEVGGTEEAESSEDEASLLLSNVEVLELLQKNLAENGPSHRRWKNRDWVQKQVVEYLQSTPCTRLDPGRRREFQSLLESRKRRARPSSRGAAAAATTTTTTSPKPSPPLEPPIPDAAPSSGGNVQTSLNSSAVLDSRGARTSDGGAAANASSVSSGDGPAGDGRDSDLITSGFGLARSEALQILNFMPTAVVELHLLIDDLDSRFTETQQNRLLETISRYTVARPSRDLAAAVAATDAKDRVASEQDHADSEGVRATCSSSFDQQFNGHT